MRLTHKQRLFIAEYVQSWNAADAARRAGYSQKWAKEMGAENLSKPHIQAEIDRFFREKTMKADEVLGRLAEQARGSIEPFLKAGEKGALTLDLEAAKKAGKLHLIKKLRQTADGLMVELHDAQAALVHIGRHQKLFSDSVELTGRDGTPLLPVEAVVAALRAADRGQRDEG